MKRGLLLVFLVLLSVSLVSASGTAHCEDNWDNDGDGRFDADGGCLNLTTGFLDPVIAPVTGTDLDRMDYCLVDGLVYVRPDPGCENYLDESEENMCGDGYDNDYDGRVDATGGCDTDGDTKIDLICGCDLDRDGALDPVAELMQKADCRSGFVFGCEDLRGYPSGYVINEALTCDKVGGFYYMPDDECAGGADDDESAANFQAYVEPTEYTPYSGEVEAPLVIESETGPDLGNFVRGFAPEEEQSWFMAFLSWFGLVE